MANPGLQPDRTVNFSHCTAPICCMEQRSAACTLRSHHESGIGVSLQVELPQKSACDRLPYFPTRLQNDGPSWILAAGPYETACRTQMHVRFDRCASNICAQCWGRHQVFAFEG